MAKSKSSAGIVRYMAPRQPAQVIRVSAPRAAPKKKHHRKGHSGAGSLTQSRLIEMAVGGAAFGFIQKNFGAQLPTLPMIGRAGTITLIAYYLGKSKGGIMRDVAIAGAVISGYQIGTEGKISGTEGVMGIAAQV